MKAVRCFVILCAGSAFLAGSPTLVAADDFSVHRGNLLVSWAKAPDRQGLLTVLKQQIEAARWQAFLAAGTVKGAKSKQHLQSTINVLTGREGKEYDDANDHPGDGYGVLNYIDDALKEVAMAIEAPGAGERVRVQGAKVTRSLENMRGWTVEGISYAVKGVEASDDRIVWRNATVTKNLMFVLETGYDVNADGIIGEDEGGLQKVLDDIALMLPEDNGRD